MKGRFLARLLLLAYLVVRMASVVVPFFVKVVVAITLRGLRRHKKARKRGLFVLRVIEAVLVVVVPASFFTLAVESCGDAGVTLVDGTNVLHNAKPVAYVMDVTSSLALLVFGVASPLYSVVRAVLVACHLAHVWEVVLVCLQVVQWHRGSRQCKIE